MSITNEAFAARWIRVAVVYFAAAVFLGIVMAASEDFRLRGLHVHLNMLGWVSMALFGTVYRLFPRAAATRLAAAHFWLDQLALPVTMASLAGLLLGHAALAPLVAAASIAVGVAVLLFAASVWRGTAASAVDVEQMQLAA